MVSSPFVDHAALSTVVMFVFVSCSFSCKIYGKRNSL